MKKFFSDSAKRIFDRLQREQTAHIVYVMKDDNGLRTKPVNSPRANDLYSNSKVYVLGVYNSLCPAKWIEDDLIWLDKLFATE